MEVFDLLGGPGAKSAKPGLSGDAKRGLSGYGKPKEVIQETDESRRTREKCLLRLSQVWNIPTDETAQQQVYAEYMALRRYALIMIETGKVQTNQEAWVAARIKLNDRCSMGKIWFKLIAGKHNTCPNVQSGRWRRLQVNLQHVLLSYVLLLGGTGLTVPQESYTP